MGTEDAAYTVTEAQLLQGFSDPNGDTLSIANLTAANGSVTSQVVGGVKTFTIMPTKDFAGTMVLNFNVSDGHGNSISGSNGYAVNGTPDAATFGGVSSASVGKADQGKVGGTVTVTDPDSGQAKFKAPASLAGTFGTFEFNADTGVWSYDVDNANPNVAGLTGNLTLTDKLVIKSVDDTSTELKVTITSGASNSAPALTGQKATLPAVNEDGSITVTAAQLLQGFSDGDGDPLSVTGLTAANATVTASGTSYVIKPGANWNGTLQLAYSVTDGKASVAATQSLVVTPVADAAVFNGTLKATIGEDQAGTVGGKLTVTDPDTGEAAFQVVAAGDLKTAHGTFTFNKDTGDWTFDVDETLASVQALKAGETSVDKLTVKSIDGTTATIEATINGANEPVPVPINGSSARDVLTGTAAGEIFEGKGGNDRMTGGGGADTFVFAGKFGRDRITDFEASSGPDHDVLDLSAIKSITDFSDLVENHVKDVAAGLKIVAGDHSILLIGVEKAELTSDDVLI